MSWSLISAKVQQVTKKLASEFAEMTPAPHDRLLSERRLQVYERLMRAGQFRPCIWAKAECSETGETYRVNGKHTSTLLSRIAGEVQQIYVTIESYDCPTLEDVGRLYGTFDSAIASRSTSDVNRAFAATVPELASLPRKVIDACVTGMAIHEIGGVSGGREFGTPADRAERLLDHPEFVLWAASILSPMEKAKHMCRGGVVGAMFGSRQKAKRDAELFWVAVRDETGERPTLPDRQLAKWLGTTSVSNARSAPHLPANRKAEPREFYVRCTHAWNAWRRGEDVKLLKYYADAKIPAFV